MEGYLWKKGHTIPTMNRRFCVLKGTLFAYYTSEQEYLSRLKPRKVLEIVQCHEFQTTGLPSSSSSFRHAQRGFEVEYLGGKKYTLVADSKDTKASWVQALKFALDEPDRIAQEEIEEAQQQVWHDKHNVQRAMNQAKQCVTGAQEATEQTRQYESQLIQLRNELESLQQQMMVSRIRYEEACKRTRDAKRELDNTTTVKSRANLGSSSSSPAKVEQQNDHVALLEAQYQVELSYEETCRKEVEGLQNQMARNQQEQTTLTRQTQESAQQAKSLREEAAKAIQQAQLVKQQLNERVQNWNQPRDPSSPLASPTASSHLDPLAEGYLLARMSTRKIKLERFYFVLYGSTLCWFNGADEYMKHVDMPRGYLHIAGLSEWDGKLAGGKVFPNAFSMLSFEGTTILCSAPIAQSATAWKTALHMAMAMPPLSPHRALRAKMKRNAANIEALPFVAENVIESTPPSQVVSTSQASTHLPAERPQEPKLEVVEGYLVKKSQLVPVMVKKYAVLKGLELVFFDSHEAYSTTDSAASFSSSSTLLVNVEEWDGVASLMHYKHGFQVTTIKNEQIYCSAPNDNEQQKWLKGIRLALAKYKHQVLSPTRQEDLLIAQASASASDVHVVPELLKLDQELLAMGCSDKSCEARLEFLKSRLVQLLEAFYQQHNASKLLGVKDLVSHSFGAQQEVQLIQEIDRVYGTSLLTQPETQQVLGLLARLRDVPDDPTKVLSEFVCMEGYLKHKVLSADKSHESAARGPQLDELANAFFVLRANKLLRYESRLEYENKPQDVHQNWEIVNVQTHQEEDRTKPTSQFECLALEQQASGHLRHRLIFMANSDKDQVLWVSRIRSGLGFAAAHAHAHAQAQAHASESPFGPAVGPEKGLCLPPSVNPRAHEALTVLRGKLVEFYRHYNPSKVLEVDTLLDLFEGNYHDLLTRLDSVYQTKLASDTELIALCRQANTASSSSTAQTQQLAHHFESYLLVNLAVLAPSAKHSNDVTPHSPGSSSFRRVYGVLHGDWISFHENFASVVREHDVRPGGIATVVAAPTPKKPLWEDRVVNVSFLNEKLKQLHAFCIETQQFGAFLAKAESPELVDEWMRVLRTVVDEHVQAKRVQLREDAQATSPTYGDSTHSVAGSESHPLFAILVEFYRVHNPSKVEEVTTLLEAFAGVEIVLLKEIDTIYHTHLADQPAVQAILAQLRHQEVQPTTEPAILMEGYLLKRGHNIPSMRKRYCVLIKSELLYFATQLESKDRTKAYGSFHVAIVSDWHGKTTTHQYPHGIELETDDGKTFFISALSAEDKHKWMLAFRTAVAMAHKSTRTNNVLARPRPEPDSNLSSDVNQQQDVQAPLRERLLAFYRDHNPSRIKDVDFLLGFFRNRELLLLKALDETYSTNFANDEAMLKLVPRASPTSMLINDPGRRVSNTTMKSLQTLKYDGSLLRSIGSVSFKHPQQVYASIDGVRLRFFASREGFKSGLSDPAATAAGLRSHLASSGGDQLSDVLIIDLSKTPKDPKYTSTGSDSNNNKSTTRCENVFAVETSDHTWMYFQAPNSNEYSIWIEVIQAAIDCQLGRDVLEEEVICGSQTDAQGFDGDLGFASDVTRTSSAIAMQGKLKFVTSELFAASSSKSSGQQGLVEAFCIIFGGSDELLVYESKEQDNILRVIQMVVATGSSMPGSNQVAAARTVQGFLKSLTVLSTRKWDSRPSECQFCFQLATLDADGTNCVMGVSAPSDLDRAKWLRQLRVGIRKVQAMELLQEQSEQVHKVEELQHQQVGSDTAKQADSVSHLASSKEIVVPSSLAGDANMIQIKGYLLFRCGNVLGDGSSSPHPLLKHSNNQRREVFAVVQKDAFLTLYNDEMTYIHHLHQGDPSGLVFTARIVKCAPTSSLLDIEVETNDVDNPVVVLTCSSSVEKTKWMQLILRALKTNQAQQLLDDEQQVLAMEQELHHNQHQHLHQTQDPDVFGQVDPKEPSEPNQAAKRQGSRDWDPKHHFVVPGSSMEGSLKKCSVFFGNSNELYFVLLKNHLLAFNNQQEALVMASNATLTQKIEEEEKEQASGTHNPLVPLPPRTDLMSPLMDSFFSSSEAMEILSVSEWFPSRLRSTKTLSGNRCDRAETEAVDNTGFKVEVKLVGHGTTSSTTKETIYLSASCSEERDAWVKATQRELEFSVVERLLQSQAQEIHNHALSPQLGYEFASSLPVNASNPIDAMASTAVGTNAAISANVSQSMPKPMDQRVCVSYKGTLWYLGHTLKVKSGFKQRFCVLHNLNLMIFMTKHAFDAGWATCRQGGVSSDWESSNGSEMAHENSDLCRSLDALESHAHKKVVVANVTELSSPDILKSLRFGFRLETTKGQLIEFCVDSIQERDNWVLKLQQAIRNSLLPASTASLSASTGNSGSTQFMKRDALLPAIPDAALEGFLLVEHDTNSSVAELMVHGVSRYVVLRGLSLMLYESQVDALNPQKKPSHVYDVDHVSHWMRKADSGGGLQIKRKGFLIHIKPSTTAFAGAADPVVKCKAQSSLEKLQWMQAIDQQRLAIATVSGQLVEAMHKQQDKSKFQLEIKSKLEEVASDARRRSMLLSQCLDDALLHEDSEDEEDTSLEVDDSPDEKEGDQEAALQLQLLHDESADSESPARVDFIDMNPENSPMHRQAGHYFQTTGPGHSASKVLTVENGAANEKNAGKSSWWTSFWGQSPWQNCFCTCWSGSNRANVSSIAPFPLDDTWEYQYEYFYQAMND